MSQTLDPQEIYETEVKFLSTADGGRKSPINWCFAAYRPDIKVSGEPTYHGAAFMAAPSLINPGDSMIVELAFWCCDGEHDQFVAGKDFEVYEGPHLVAHGKFISKGRKSYVRST